jgi:hypothetical protein
MISWRWSIRSARAVPTQAPVEEVRWELAGGIPAVRRICDDAGHGGARRGAVYDHRWESAAGDRLHDLTRFDEIARTVRPAGQ